MVFSSWPFVFVFLPIALGVFHYLLRKNAEWSKAWLIIASLFFYAYWKVEYLPLLLGSMAVNFLIAYWMNTPKATHRQWLLFAGILINLLGLGYFKYTEFIISLIPWAEGTAPGRFNVELPLAISFFTFTQIAYLVDVYRDKTLRYSTSDYVFFVVFFPHLIAGPIVRHGEIIPQLKEWAQRFSSRDFYMGLTLFVLGLGKKCFLADTLAPHVDNVYNTAAQGVAVSGGDAWLGTIGFALQIYFDFSAYSDMALGLAAMFGLRFPVNFNSPYKASSVIQFWNHWHITLSRFLRDYVYFPLGGSRVGRVRKAFNVFATMLVSGLWHGAGVTYLVWGGLHGAFLVMAHLWRDSSWASKIAKLKVVQILSVLVTFTAVTMAWVWFRAENAGTAWQMTLAMVGIGPEVTGVPLIGSGMKVLLPMLLILVWFLPNTQQLLYAYQPAVEKVEPPRFGALQLNFGVAIVIGAIFFMVAREFFVSRTNVFIYFQF
jgi:alginate O-acetyltransferase complex protein AlgI